MPSLLDYILLQVPRLSKSLKKEELDITLVSSLVDGTLQSMDDVLDPAAQWVQDLQEVKEEMKNEVGINFSSGDVESFQSRVTEPFYIKLKENIQNASLHWTRCFSIFNPKKVSEIYTYIEDKIETLSEHYELKYPAQQFFGDEFVIPPILISSQDIPTEWKTFRRCMVNQPKEDIREQLRNCQPIL